MKRTGKRIALVTAIVFMLGMFVWPAFAQTTITTEKDTEGTKDNYFYNCSNDLYGTDQYTYYTEFSQLNFETLEDEIVTKPHTVPVSLFPVGTTITSDYISGDKDAHMFVDRDEPGNYIWGRMEGYFYTIDFHNDFTIPDAEHYYFIYTVHDFQPLMQMDKGFWVKGVEAAPSRAEPEESVSDAPADPGEKVSPPSAVTAPAPATPTASKVLVNGEGVSFDAYNIEGHNYFKLRGMAQALSGSEKQFEVEWDGAKNAINLVSGAAYTTVGGEFTAGPLEAATAVPCNSVIYMDGQPVALTAYTINANNYFKLRDIGEAFGFKVAWDADSNMIIINTADGEDAGDSVD